MNHMEDNRRHLHIHTNPQNINAYTTIVFSILLFIAIALDIFFPSEFITEPLNRYFGVVFIIIGTIIIYWTQDFDNKFSNLKEKGHEITVKNLCIGPYRHSRNPKSIGLGLLLIGLGFALNSILVILAAGLSVIIINFFFLDKKEEQMCELHGEAYKEYQKKVNRWF